MATIHVPLLLPLRRRQQQKLRQTSSEEKIQTECCFFRPQIFYRVRQHGVLQASLPFPLSSPIARSHQTGHLPTTAQVRGTNLDPLRRANPHECLNYPLVPDLAVVRLPPHANLELAIRRDVEGLLTHLGTQVSHGSQARRGGGKGEKSDQQQPTYLEGKEDGEPRNHILALAINHVRQRAQLD